MSLSVFVDIFHNGLLDLLIAQLVISYVAVFNNFCVTAVAIDRLVQRFAVIINVLHQNAVGFYYVRFFHLCMLKYEVFPVGSY